nr:nitronate monooxygenase [Brevundimonas naejangsanensis]
MSRIISNLRLPVIAAPMFLVSGPELVIAACKAGVIGSFPVANCRTSEDLDRWLTQITEALTPQDAVWAVNLVVHRLNRRLADDLALIVRYKPPLVITALGSPAEVIEAVHAYGGQVFADVSTVEHARKAAASGVDGLILISAGAGGHTGSITGFAFVPAVREFWSGPLVLGGGLSTGAAIDAALTLGADYAYVGTPFIATEESLAKDAYKAMLVEAEIRDLIVTDAFTGIPNCMLRPSIVAAGIDPDAIPASERSRIDFDDPHKGAKAWRDIWSAGQGVGAIRTVRPVLQVVDDLIDSLSAHRMRRAAA